MGATGKHLRIKSMGECVLGVELEGNPAKPEPIYFRVRFPGGSVDVVRLDDGQYWVHVDTVRKDEDGSPLANPPRIVDARLDISSMHAAEVDVGDFAHPDLYHLAVRIARENGEEVES